MSNKLNIYDWVFIKNPYTETWCATKRENYNLLFSNINSEKILKSKSITTLEDIIFRTNGEPDKINKLLKNDKSI